MIISKKCLQSRPLKVSIGGNEIREVNHLKYLGVTLDKNLT